MVMSGNDRCGRKNTNVDVSVWVVGINGCV